MTNIQVKKAIKTPKQKQSYTFIHGNFVPSMFNIKCSLIEYIFLSRFLQGTVKFTQILKAVQRFKLWNQQNGKVKLQMMNNSHRNE